MTPHNTGSTYNEKNLTESEKVQINGIEFEVMENNGQTQAQWNDESYTYVIRGDVTFKEINTIISSLK